MIKILIFVISLLAYQITSASYNHYDANGRIVSTSMYPEDHFDKNDLQDLYIFTNKKSNSISMSFTKENVMKVGNTYIFNESSTQNAFNGSNDNYFFDKILTVQEQLKKSQLIVKSVLIENKKKIINDDTSILPMLTYKPYILIVKYSLIDQSHKIIYTIKERSEMQYLTLKECNSVANNYKKIYQKELSEKYHNHNKSDLIKESLSFSCSKINRD